MEELLRTNNPVEISVIRARFEEAGIVFSIADEFTSGMEGSIGAIPRRILVDADQAERARQLLSDILPESS
ncbi:MAG: hypothetical protein CMK09_06730 [Ponticaulis sp.]|nr:hypothetical protein [Ponticaulis sp.]